MSEERLSAIEAQLVDGRRRMDVLEAAVGENTDLTRDIRDIMVAARVGFKVLGGLGTLAKWSLYICGAAAAVWGLIHGAPKP